MRPNAQYFLLLFLLSFLGLVQAGPVTGLVRRQDDGASSSSSSSIPSDSISTGPTSTSESSTSVATSDTSTAPPSVSSVSSVPPSNSTFIVSTISVPSITLQTSPTATPPSEPPTDGRDANTPAAFFANRSATLVLGITAGAIGFIIVLLVLWINFRRAWYFPWNRRKKRNDPNRWSTYSFREKPHLPLGRNLEVTPSTENFAKPITQSTDGHSILDHSNHGHSEAHVHYEEMDDIVPPLPRIRIDGPRNGPWPPHGPPGLEDRSRWSKATSDASMSIYSQHTHSIYEDVRAASQYTTNERVFTPMPPTRVTSSSSEASPFRFDEIERDQPLPSSRQTSEATPFSLPSFPPQAATGAAQDATRSELGTMPRTGVYFSDTSDRQARQREGGKRDERYRLSIVERGSSPNETFLRMVGAPATEPDLPPADGNKKQPPKGILKTPHYLTTSARLTANSRGNMI